MNKFIFIIGMLLIPNFAHASFFIETGQGSLYFRTPKVQQAVYDLWGKAHLSGNNFAIGYKDEKWAIRLGGSRMKMHSNKTFLDLREALELPATISVEIANIEWNSYNETITMQEIVEKNPILLPYVSEISGLIDKEASLNLVAGNYDLSYEIDLSPVYDDIDTDLSFTVTSYYLDILRYWEITNNLNLYSGIGLVSLSAEATAKINVGDYLLVTETVKESALSLRVTLGIEWRINESLSVAYERIAITDRDYYKSVGLKYRYTFGQKKTF